MSPTVSNPPNTQNATKPPTRIFVFDTMRTRSFLFMRYFSTNPQLNPQLFTFMHAAWLGPENWWQHCQPSGMARNEEIAAIMGPDTIASARAQYEEFVLESEKQGRTSFAKAHAFNILKVDVLLDLLRNPDSTLIGRENPTHFPDYLFQTISPIFIIRHPVLKLSSTYRDVVALSKMKYDDEDTEAMMSYKFLRCLFDLFRERGREAVVVDAEDMLWRTEEMTKNVCDKLGLDPTEMSQKWDKVPESERTSSPVIAAWLRTMYESEGIERPEVRREIAGVEEAYEAWKREYGDEWVADKLRFWYDQAMPHYEYMVQFKA